LCVELSYPTPHEEMMNLVRMSASMNSFLFMGGTIFYPFVSLPSVRLAPVKQVFRENAPDNLSGMEKGINHISILRARLP
jgi:hypothetical protein